MNSLALSDDQALADLQRYAAAARTLDADAAIRLVASGGVLAAYTCVLPGRGLTGAGTILGLRTFALRDGGAVDVVVPVAAILDRIAHVAAGSGSAIPVPPMSLFVPWAAMSPPRAGWELVGEYAAPDLLAQVREGVTTLGQAGTGLAAQVDALRATVWGAPLPGSTAPRGLAFGAYSLRFLAPDQPAQLLRAGNWWRLHTAGGHILAR
ncbi:hypothetical protein [Nostocoides sp.]|uniref:hypothetical protein n=1 Tax=Nostocoides sp. TaxID=1917966 RepID=UPI002B6F8D0B|nr:hypothetical protein [Tetrasphaera sp.]